MSQRYFSAQPITAERVTLMGAEAHHLLHVMRVATNDGVTLFDDSGMEFFAVVETRGRSEVGLRIVERREIDRELTFSLSVGVALPKGDRQKVLVEKLTELGVTTLVPLATERGVAQPTAGSLDRMRRAVVESSKQCGRNRLMQITEPQGWAEWIRQSAHAGDHPAPELPSASRRLIAHPGGVPLNEVDLRTPIRTQVAIGPEGGFTEQEIAAALAAGWQQVSLGPRILRVETAAVALAAMIAL